VAGFFIIFRVFACSADNTGSVWTLINSNMPVAREVAASIVVDKDIYLIGGLLDGNGMVATNEVDMFDTETGNWEIKTPAPTARWGAAAASVDGKLFVVSAGSPIPSGSQNVEEYDPNTDTWSEKAPMPDPGWGAGSAAVNGKIYVIGGYDWQNWGEDANREYDPQTDTWTLKAPMPTRRSWLGIGEINNKIYVVGGLSWDDSVILPTLEAYDPRTDTWETKTPAPVGLGSFSTTVLDNKLYVIGGNNTTATYVYDPSSDTWSQLNQTLPIPISGASAQVVDGAIYLLGGQSDSGMLDTVYTLQNKNVPSLSDLGQFEPDGTTPIAEGATTTENTIVFQGSANNLLNNQIELQVEVKPFDVAFTDAPTVNSSFVYSWGQPISVTVSNLTTGKYHWQARSVDSQGAASAWQEFGTTGNADFEVQSPLAVSAATLAKELINQPYLWGGKGWDFIQKQFVSADNVKSGYQYWDSTAKKISTGIGVDCSGLVMWSYNRNFDPTKPFLQNFVKYEGADGQYRYNTAQISEPQIEPGDVMFFDNVDQNGNRGQDGHMDHVAMYVGESGGFDVVQAASQDIGIIKSSKNVLSQLPTFVAFNKVISAPTPPVQILTGSPVDLIVTDPNGFTITSTTTISSGEEDLHEIPGELYYSIYNVEPDGTPQAEVYSPKLEQGNYIIKPVKRQDAPAGAVYSITVNSDAGTVVVADNVPVNSIPQNGYGISVQANAVTKIDINPPTTASSVAGTLGANNWYTSNVTVALSAIDTESGVASTDYSLDNGSTWLIYSSKSPIVINKEGTTTVVYYSVDNAGNKEAENKLKIKIDKTPPEAKISVDLSAKDLLVTGVDNLSPTTVSKDSSGNYIITDQAGHTTKLIFSKTYAGKILTYAKLTGIQYDNNPTVKLPSSYFLYIWNFLVNPPVLISQTIYVDNTYSIEAAYDKKSNQTTVLLLQKGTTIKKQVFPGLEIIKLTTSKGVISYEP